MPTRTMGERLEEALARIKELEGENEVLRQQLAQAENQHSPQKTENRGNTPTPESDD